MIDEHPSNGLKDGILRNDDWDRWVHRHLKLLSSIDHIQVAIVIQINHSSTMAGATWWLFRPSKKMMTDDTVQKSLFISIIIVIIIRDGNIRLFRSTDSEIRLSIAIQIGQKWTNRPWSNGLKNFGRVGSITFVHENLVLVAN